MKKRSILFMTAIASLCLTGCDLTDLIGTTIADSITNSTDSTGDNQNTGDGGDEQDAVALSIKELIGVPSEINQNAVLTASGIFAEVLYSDDSIKTEAVTKVELDTSKVGQAKGLAYVGSLSSEFSIKVKAEEEHHDDDDDEIIAVSLKELTGVPTEIKQNEVLSTSGLEATVVYSDGSEKIEPVTKIELDTSNVGQVNGIAYVDTLFIEFSIEVKAEEGHHDDEVVALSIKELIGIPSEIEQNAVLSITGLSAKVVYSDDSIKTEAVTRVELDTSKAGEVTGKAYVNTLVKTFTINVKAKQEEKTPVLTSISVSGQTLTYIVGDTFSFDGVCKATYSDGTTATVIPTSVSKPNMSSVGTVSITVTYSEDGVTKTTSYSISIENESQETDTYYANISTSATGDSLLSSLRSLNSSKRKSTVGYSAMGTTPSGQFKYTDYDPATIKYDNNGQPYGTKLITFYSGNSATSGMNREHVWPNSHGGNVVENDIHMPRPTLQAENGSRGNSFYVEGKCHSSSGWDPAMESFGDESYRGDSARIIFYCCIANDKLSLIDEDSHSTSNSNKDYLMGKLSDLLKWNLKYPVQDREQRRNSGAEYLQGNRNPFIDHPEYACKIWGNTNATTKSICGIK